MPWKQKRQSRVTFALEAQGGFSSRLSGDEMVYYGCRLISFQNGMEFTKSNYQNIKKIYNIWIALRPSEERENTITRYREVRVKQRVLETEFSIPMREEMKGGFHNMGGIGDMIEQEILVKSRAEGSADSIRNLMETLNLTIEQAMNALKVPDSERRIYANLLANQ